VATDVKGHYDLFELQFGTYYVVASKPTYPCTQSASVSVTAYALVNGPPRQDFTLPCQATSAPPPGISAVEMQGIYMTDSQNGVIVIDSGVYATADGARSWHEIATPPLSNQFNRFVDAYRVDASDIEVISFTKVLTTIDGGKTWRSADLSLSIWARVQFADAMHGWILDSKNGQDSDYVYATTDGGLSWQLVADASSGGLSTSCGLGPIAFSDAQNGWILPGWCQSSDGGRTWHPGPTVSTPSGWTGWRGIDIRFFSPSDGVVLAENTECCTQPPAVLPLITHDGGASWTQAASVASVIPFFDQLRGMSDAWVMDNNNGFVAAGLEHFLSPNWTHVTSQVDDRYPSLGRYRAPQGVQHSLLDFVDGSHGFAYWSSEVQMGWFITYVYTTDDGGMHWTRQDFTIS
jgi:photosystem II stability/assembly factor-like uncharacterized protein